MNFARLIGWLIGQVILLGILTVFNFYFWNFVLNVFNINFQLTWMQALVVIFIFRIIRLLFAKEKA